MLAAAVPLVLVAAEGEGVGEWVFTLIFLGSAVYICYIQAKEKRRNTTLAIVLGLFLNWIAAIGYLAIRPLPDNGLPPPPPSPAVPAPKRPPELLTFGATLVAVVATVMTLPAAATTFTPESGAPGWEGPSGWQKGLWIVAFFIGVPSMALALRALRRERERKSRSGRLLAGGAACIAWIGAFLWALPVIVQASSGL